MSNSPGAKFQPIGIGNAPPNDSGLPSEIWTIIQSAPADFPPQYFLDVSLNLLENPNLTASYLSRAELSYKSFTDATFNPDANHPHELASIIKHLKPDHQPRLLDATPAGYSLTWTVVRKLIPRNPKVDEPLLQTCHLFTSNPQNSNIERYLVVYLPHVSDPDSIPFYHPKVRGVAILYIHLANPPPTVAPGTLSVFFDLFPERPLDNRMSRTALKMLEIIHKHSHGRMQGYQKRVHHDIMIPQKTFQDTYTYLKGKYAKELMDNWVEQTPASKHVFEDLGIAAFLIELWTEMYGGDDPPSDKNTSAAPSPSSTPAPDHPPKSPSTAPTPRTRAQAAFPGFLDIGCGNGLLVYILNRESWHGTGFDARARKTWTTFPAPYPSHLRAALLVPSLLAPPTHPDYASGAWHTGVVAPGTFIISNHADELTPWTPLLAFASRSPFIAIPCCSHDLSGARTRAKYRAEHFPVERPQGEMPRKEGKKNQVSAYAALCSYVAYLAAEVGYVVEKEYLRIPSTRNIAIVGRKWKEGDGEDGVELEERMEIVRGLVEREMGGEALEEAGRRWVERGGGLMKPGKGGH